jgi:hypothetical protein
MGHVDGRRGRRRARGGLTIVAVVAGDGNWGSTAGPQAARRGSGSTGIPNAEEHDPSSAGGKLLPRTVSLGSCTVRARHTD